MRNNIRNIHQLRAYLQVQRILYLLLLISYAKALKEVLEVGGEATVTVPEVLFDPFTGNAITEDYVTPTLPSRAVLLQSGQAVLFNRDTKEPIMILREGILVNTVYGVDIDLTIEPGVIVLTDEGYSTVDTTFRYTILPACEPPEDCLTPEEQPRGYNAIIADIDFYTIDEDDNEEWAGYLTGDSTQGEGTGVFIAGSYFDITKRYEAEVILNWGTEIEIRGDRVPLNIVQVEIEEIKGLYTEDGSYVSGYKSDDNKGRIYSNRIYDANDLSKTIWTKNKQYIDIKVKIKPESVSIPEGARIAWEVEDPDDPSNEAIDVSADSKEILDPNDYDSVDNDGDGAVDNSDGNDNRGDRDDADIWEELHADYALTGNETKIKDGVSKVRFSATDDGGDNFIIKAKLKLDAEAMPYGSDETGFMTIWKKINVEYVRMNGSGGGSSADPVPIDEINNHYKKAFVEFDILQERLVDPKFVKYNTDPTRDYWAIGLQDEEPIVPDYAPDNLKSYVTKTDGEFSREDKGWYFMTAAHDWIPLSSIKSLVLYPRPVEQNDTNNQLSDWAFGGVKRGINTSSNHELYVRLDKPSDVRVRVFSDAAFSNLVAEGTGSSEEIALNEMNNSGLYGFVKAFYTTDDSDIILILEDQGNATIAGVAESDEKYQITLDNPLPSGPGIANLYEIRESFIYLYNNDLSKNIGFGLLAQFTSSDRKTVVVQPHMYSPIDDPNTIVLKYLTDHGWSKNDVVKVKIYSPGAYGTAGINSSVEEGNNIYFNGRVMFFSGFSDTLEIVLHELGHALGFAHRCGNKDYKNVNTCFMEYGVDWLLTMPYDPDPSNRNLIPWSNGNVGLDLGPYHIDMIRKTNLEQDSLGRKLGW